MGDTPPKLLHLMERDWVQEEKKLELKLGPPAAEDWGSPPSSSSLGYFPQASKTTKRGFLHTANSKTEEFQACRPQPSHAAAASLTQPRTTPVPPVVGWPPIRSFRKNLTSSSAKLPQVELKQSESETSAKPEICSKSPFVKINMDGIPIGRKVDLNAYDSYDELSSAVGELFQVLLAAQKDIIPISGVMVSGGEKQAFAGLLDGTGEYTLVYEDNEGDRMLVGDVPWEMFVSTAKRLRVLKSSELPTLALGSVSRKRTATEC